MHSSAQCSIERSTTYRSIETGLGLHTPVLLKKNESLYESLTIAHSNATLLESVALLHAEPFGSAAASSGTTYTCLFMGMEASIECSSNWAEITVNDNSR